MVKLIQIQKRSYLATDDFCIDNHHHHDTTKKKTTTNADSTNNQKATTTTRLPWTKEDLLMQQQDNSHHHHGYHIILSSMDQQMIQQELKQWFQEQPTIIEEDVTVDDVTKRMKRLSKIAQRARQELVYHTGVARISSPFATNQQQQEHENDNNDLLLRRYYLAFGLLLGQPLVSGKNKYGRLYQVQDRGGDYTQTAIPVSQTKAQTGFHTDSSTKDILPDLVGLLCIHPAHRGGGASRIACGLLAYEKMKERYPGLCQLLEEPHYRDIILTKPTNTTTNNNNEDDDDQIQQQRRENAFPVFDTTTTTDNEVVRLRYMRFWIERGYEKLQIRPPPKLQQAMDVLDDILEESVVTFTLQRGEMLWVHNTTVVHDRTAYYDDPTKRPKRLLLRQWITII